MPTRPTLTLAEIDAFDPQGPPARKWCPLCGDGKPRDAAHRSLSIERSSGLWKCFRCGESGLAKEFWTEKAPESPRQKRAGLRAAFDSPPAPVSKPAEPSGVGESKPDWKPLWDATLPLEGTPGEAYLLRRGIPLEVARLAMVHWAPNWSGQGSVVFPIQARGREIVAAQGRAVRGDAKITKGPKKTGAFFAPVSLPGGRICGPLDAAVPAVILVEAPIDALSLAACGFPALALCGTTGPGWLHIACGLRDVALAFDADEAGERAAEEAQKRLQPYGARCKRLRPEGFKDWNECLLEQGTNGLKDWLAGWLLAG